MDGIYEPVLDLDDFKKPKVLTDWEGIVFSVITVLFGKPGFYPSIPELGLNIQKYRNTLTDMVDPDELKAALIYQCSKIGDELENNGLEIYKSHQGTRDFIVISIPYITEKGNNRLIIGLSGQDDGDAYNYGLFDMTTTTTGGTVNG